MFISTHIPLPPQTLPAGSDKVAHFGAYFGLAVLICLRQLAQGYSLTFKRSTAIFAAMVAYAAIDELLQIPVGRYADWQDGLADASGALAGLIATWFISGRVQPNPPDSP